MPGRPSAKADPGNAVRQRDLSVSFNWIGDVPERKSAREPVGVLNGLILTAAGAQAAIS
jgi:hypothetical protein